MTKTIVHEKGERFGRLTLTGRKKSVSGRISWEAQCDCGSGLKYYQGKKIRIGHTKSCCCIAAELRSLPKFISHNRSRTVEYKTYHGILQRCYNESAGKYNIYGGRGITVCDRWLESFENFYADMGDRPEGFTLDRIDGDGPYSQENCRWADIYTQNNNRRGCRLHGKV